MKTKTGKFALFTACLLCVVLLSACRPEAVAPEEGQVIMLSPSAESIIDTDTVTVSVFIDNFNLMASSGQANKRGEGHLVYYRDVTPPLVKGKTALTQPGSYFVSSEKSYSWKNVEAGPHNFWVQIVNNDDTPLEPPAAVRAPVTVVLK